MGRNYEWVVPILATWVVAITSWQCTNSGNSDGGHYEWVKLGRPSCKTVHFERLGGLGPKESKMMPKL